MVESGEFPPVLRDPEQETHIQEGFSLPSSYSVPLKAGEFFSYGMRAIVLRFGRKVKPSPSGSPAFRGIGGRPDGGDGRAKLLLDKGIPGN